jgi:hypothetical protein
MIMNRYRVLTFWTLAKITLTTKTGVLVAMVRQANSIRAAGIRVAAGTVARRRTVGD